MKRIMVILLFIFVSAIYPQTKYFIYFKDKGVTKTSILQKSSSGYKIAEQQLSPKAIERRKQVLGENNYITYEDLPLTENYVQGVQSLGVKIINQLRWFNAVTAYLDDNQLQAVNNLSYVEKVVPVAVLNKIQDPIPNGQVPQKQEPQNILPKINSSLKTTTLNYGPSFTEYNLSDIPAVHALGIQGTGVYIGILDDGFTYKIYNALKTRKVLRQYDYVHQVDTVSNQEGHGSAVFCTIAGYDPGNQIGPAYDAQFFLAETENDASESIAEEDNYAAALQDMEAAGVEITTSSLGYAFDFTIGASHTYADMNGTTTVVAIAANIAYNLGISTFTAAGNDGSRWGPAEGGLNSPADAINIITVGAVDQSKLLAYFSSLGPTSDGRIKPEVCAMGYGNVWASTDGVSYGIANGTSCATPIVAGIAALLKSAWPHLTNFQIRKTFLECCYPEDTPIPNNSYGYGVISATKVISYPNLSQIDSVTFKLNKIFIDSKGINPSSVKLYYSTGSNSFQSVPMNYDGTLKYSYQLPNSPKNTLLEFYFTYKETTGGAQVQEPATGTFKFAYGSLNVSNLTAVNTIAQLPANFILYQNYPNPFNPATSISYQLPVSGNVKLKVYDILGREVATLVDAFKQAGNYKVTFNGSQFSSGVYLYRISVGGNQAGSYSAVKKMILIK
jgi:serine protease AprX